MCPPQDLGLGGPVVTPDRRARRTTGRPTDAHRTGVARTQAAQPVAPQVMAGRGCRSVPTGHRARPARPTDSRAGHHGPPATWAGRAPDLRTTLRGMIGTVGR